MRQPFAAPRSKNKLATGLEHVKLENRHKCDSCALGKSFRRHVPSKSNREPSQRPLELVHMDTLSVDTPDHKGRKYALVIVGRRFSSSSSCYRTTRFTSVHHTPSRRTSSPTTETRSGSSQWPAPSSPFIWARGGIQLESPRPEKSSSSGPRNCIQVLSKLLNSLPRLRLYTS